MKLNHLEINLVRDKRTSKGSERLQEVCFYAPVLYLSYLQEVSFTPLFLYLICRSAQVSQPCLRSKFPYIPTSPKAKVNLILLPVNLCIYIFIFFAGQPSDPPSRKASSTGKPGQQKTSMMRPPRQDKYCRHINHFQRCNLPMNPYVRLLVGGLLVGRSVGRKVICGRLSYCTLPHENRVVK